MTLAEIDDIELLRKAALLLQEDNKKLTKLLAQLKRKLHALDVSGQPNRRVVGRHGARAQDHAVPPPRFTQCETA